MFQLNLIDSLCLYHYQQLCAFFPCVYICLGWKNELAVFYVLCSIFFLFFFFFWWTMNFFSFPIFDWKIGYSILAIALMIFFKTCILISCLWLTPNIASRLSIDIFDWRWYKINSISSIRAAFCSFLIIDNTFYANIRFPSASALVHRIKYILTALCPLYAEGTLTFSLYVLGRR